MAARYLIRFDDLCPTMNWKVWERLEFFLDREGIKPILAVIPDNRDPAICFEPPNPHFWARVRSWQEKGWTIGLHGYQHVYVNREAGLLGLNANSEFSGLDRAEQARKLDAGIAGFTAEGVKPDLWIAPSHSFDAVTLELLMERGITSVSDGYFAFPGTDLRGQFWLPQQMWRFRKLPVGVWTVCQHHNLWSEADQSAFEAEVRRFRASVTGYAYEAERYGNRRLRSWEWWVARGYGRAIRLRKFLKSLLSARVEAPA